MKTGKFCPHCGRPLLKSQIRDYAFQCFGCGEDYYRIEVYGKKELETVKNIRRYAYHRELSKGLPQHSFRKHYPRQRY